MVRHEPPNFFILNQMSTLLVKIPQYFHLYFRLTSHWRSLSHLHHMHQVTLPVEIPQACHLRSLVTCHWRRLSRLHLLHQLTLPVEIRPFFLSQTQPQCSIKPSKSLKWTFPLSLSAFHMHLKPHSFNWSH